MIGQAEKAARFRALHQGPGAFVVPGVADAGTARLFAGGGFAALATSTSSLAITLGRPDDVGLVRREEVLVNAAAVAEAAPRLPVAGDFESGHGASPDDCATTVLGAAAAGLVGCSIEDSTGHFEYPLHDLDAAAARVAAAVAAARALPHDFVLVARCDNFLQRRPDLDDTLRRLSAYAEAGADCLFAPALPDADAIAAVVRAVAPKPVCVLASARTRLSAAELAQIGVKRISLGSGLVRVGLSAMLRAVDEIAVHGTFTAFNGAMSYSDVQERFRKSGV